MFIKEETGTMKKRATLLAVVPIVLLLTGCGISAGTVSEKVIEPENEYLVKYGPWKTEVDDEDYCLILTEGEQSGYVCVPQEQWKRISEGDYYNPEVN